MDDDQLAEWVAKTALDQTMSMWPDHVIQWLHGVTFGMLMMEEEPKLAPMMRRYYEEVYSVSRGKPAEEIEIVGRSTIRSVMAKARRRSTDG